MQKPKKIPRAIEVELLDKLKKIDPDINKALKSLMSVNLRESEAPKPKVDDIKELSDKIWEQLRQRVDARIDIAIEDAKRGWR